MCVSILPECMHAYHVHAWCLWRPEGGFGSSGTGAIDNCETTMWMPGIELWTSARAVNTFTGRAFSRGSNSQPVFYGVEDWGPYFPNEWLLDLNTILTPECGLAARQWVKASSFRTLTHQLHFQAELKSPGWVSMLCSIQVNACSMAGCMCERVPLPCQPVSWLKSTQPG